MPQIETQTVSGAAVRTVDGASRALIRAEGTEAEARRVMAWRNDPATRPYVFERDGVPVAFCAFARP